MIGIYYNFDEWGYTIEVLDLINNTELEVYHSDDFGCPDYTSSVFQDMVTNHYKNPLGLEKTEKYALNTANDMLKEYRANFIERNEELRNYE